MTKQQQYLEYLEAAAKPHRTLCRLEFLQPDGQIAFVLGTDKYKRGYNKGKETKAFIQGGSLNVQLNNGERRKASVTLSNLDSQFSYNINNIWFGQQVRLLMGLTLRDGTEFFLPQGTFYISNPREVFHPTEKNVTLELVDKWAYLDGTLMGQIDSAMSVTPISLGNREYGRSATIQVGAFTYADGIYRPSFSGKCGTILSFPQGKQMTISANPTDETYVEGVFFWNGNNYLGYQVRAYDETNSITFTPPENCDKIGFNVKSIVENFPDTFSISIRESSRTNVFDVIRNILHMSRFDRSDNASPQFQYDSVPPVFSNYWDDKYYTVFDGKQMKMSDVPYDITVNSDSGTLGTLISELVTVVAGLFGYDETGAFRIEPSQDDIEDKDKPVLWDFTPYNSVLCGIDESVRNNEVYNEIVCVGTGADGYEVYGVARNYDPRSDTNINLIGLRTLIDPQSTYWNAEQCVSLAEYKLKQKTIVQKSITIESVPLYHLRENRIVTVQRTDKEGSPVEKHLIQSYSIPISSTGTMSISCTSVNDFAIATTTSSALVQITDN